MLLRKLSNYSRKNRLYQEFRELGCVVRTVFLLQLLSDEKLREVIQFTTNKKDRLRVHAFVYCNKYCYLEIETPLEHSGKKSW